MKYMQTDSRWGGLGYPKAPYYIRNCGCGECSIANIIIETDKYANATPATIQPYCKQYADPKGNGTYWSGIPAMLKHYGLTDVKEHATMTPLWNELAKGNRVAVYLMGSKKAGSKGVKWTSSGHFVCSTDYKVSGGKHYVYVKDSYSNSSLRNGWITYEDNMKNDILKVWSAKLPAKASTAYVPTTPYTGKLPSKTVKKGSKGNDVKAVQNFLNWCIKAGLKVDGYCGSKTTAAIKKYQKQYKLKVDGIFGSQSKRKAQSIIDAHKPKPAPTPTPTPTKTGADKILAKAKEFAWPYGTASSKYSYSEGSAKSVYKTALKKYMGKSAKISQTDCGYFVSTCVRSRGVASTFLALPGKASQSYPAVPSTMTIVSKGKVGTLQPGDIIRYRKKSGQHVVIYLGGGLIAHASRKHAFPRISKSSPWNNSNVKKSTIQVIRAK